MSQGGYTHTTRATGTVLTAAIYNNDHQNHITNQNPQMTGGYSDNLSQMQIVTDPGTLGAESLAASLAGEIERIRFQIRALSGEAQWYIPPVNSIKNLGGLADNSIALSKLANTTQGKLMMRTASGVGPWQEADIPGLTALSPPALGDFLLGAPAAGGAPRKILISDIQPSSILAPQGRLTLTASTPVMTSVVSAATTVRYTPYAGLFVPVWNGTLIVAANTGGELTQTTTDTTKSPAACVANKNYDIFFWMDGVTPRISRGPVWTSDTARGSGAGTTELTRISGLLVNAQTIVNGPAANRGTYLGSIRTNGSAQIDYVNNIVGGAPAKLTVYNAYNRILSPIVQKDAGTSYNPGATTTRPVGNNFNNRIEFLRGLDEDLARFHAQIRVDAGGGSFFILGLGLDSTAAAGGSGTFSADGLVNSGAGQAAIVSSNAVASLLLYTGLGYHYVCALETTNTGMTVFTGNHYDLLMETMA